MARKKGSKGKGPRAKARTAYETYSSWYGKYTKGEKAGLYGDKLSKDEFEEAYREAKKAGLSNPARSVAMEQKLLDWDFLKKYKDLYGKFPTDIRDAAARQSIATDFIEDMKSYGLTSREAKDKFNDYFY